MKRLPTDMNRPAELGNYASDQALADDADLSDLELLATATQDAMDAHQVGVIVGPALDTVALARAARRARRRDASRLLRANVLCAGLLGSGKSNVVAGTTGGVA
ncbi:hypothetical protein [Actinophytocola sediminis]